MKRGAEMFPKKGKWLHLMGGVPDDDCPICRAHGLDSGLLPEGGGIVIIEMDGPRGARDCSCPLCRQVNFDA